MLDHKSLYRAIGKSMLGKYTVYFANLISLMILARIFSPETYGIVAAVTVFLLFFQLMAEAGLGPAIINKDELSTNDRDGIFSLTLILGLILGACFSLLAQFFERFYDIPGVSTVVPFVSVALFFFAASIVPNAVLLRQQSFYRLAIAGLLAEVVGTVGVLALSLIVDPLSALASKGAISAAVMSITVWIFSKHTEFGRPILGIKFTAINPLLNYSMYQFGFNFINYFSRNLDNILVGKFMGASTLGMYEKAYQLMRYPLMLLTFAMTPAIQPEIRKYAGDSKKVEEIHRDFACKLSIMGLSASVLLFLFAEWIVLILLGEKWHTVIPIIQILALAVPVQVVLSTSGSFFQAMGRVDLLFLSGLLTATVMIASIIIGITLNNIETLCWLLVISFYLSFVQTYYILYKIVFKKNLSEFIYKMIPCAIGVSILVAYSLIVN